jgi:hypothetical protein
VYRPVRTELVLLHCPGRGRTRRGRSTVHPGPVTPPIFSSSEPARHNERRDLFD